VARFDRDLLDARPATFEQIRLICESMPEVIHKVGNSRGTNVVENMRGSASTSWSVQSFTVLIGRAFGSIAGRLFRSWFSREIVALRNLLDHLKVLRDDALAAFGRISHSCDLARFSLCVEVL